MKRCWGHCCRTFSLPLGPAELEAAYHRWVALKLSPGGQRLVRGGSDKEYERFNIIQDIHLIYPMVRYLGCFNHPPFKEVNPSPRVPTHYYTCKHFSESTRSCTIYPIRPAMCRDYPYGGKCNYAGCTWTERKQTPLPKPQKVKRERRIDILPLEILDKECPTKGEKKR